VFITRHRNRWVRHTDRGDEKRGLTLDAIAYAFRKLTAKCKVKVPAGGFAVIRHTHRTVADECKDQPAAMLIMGHKDTGISRYYRERIDDSRLLAITNHVRDWLLAGRDGNEQ
jgi:integrase